MADMSICVPLILGIDVQFFSHGMRALASRCALAVHSKILSVLQMLKQRGSEQILHWGAQRKLYLPSNIRDIQIRNLLCPDLNLRE
jgi:hypothetical protein